MVRRTRGRANGAKGRTRTSPRQRGVFPLDSGENPETGINTRSRHRHATPPVRFGNDDSLQNPNHALLPQVSTSANITSDDDNIENELRERLCRLRSTTPESNAEQRETIEEQRIHSTGSTEDEQRQTTQNQNVDIVTLLAQQITQQNATQQLLTTLVQRSVATPPSTSVNSTRELGLEANKIRPELPKYDGKTKYSPFRVQFEITAQQFK